MNLPTRDEARRHPSRRRIVPKLRSTRLDRQRHLRMPVSIPPPKKKEKEEEVYPLSTTLQSTSAMKTRLATKATHEWFFALPPSSLLCTCKGPWWWFVLTRWRWLWHNWRSGWSIRARIFRHFAPDLDVNARRVAHFVHPRQQVRSSASTV